jgi:hypothetical protein
MQSTHMRRKSRVNCFKPYRYVKSAPRQGLLLSASSNLELIVYCDSDWAPFPDTRLSVIGYCVLLGGCFI